MQDDVIEICCDESGNDGENLMAGSTVVFTHGSVLLTHEDASQIMTELRNSTRSRSAEFKTKDLLKGKNWSIILDLFGKSGPLIGNANLYLAEKTYFVVGKVIDLLVEELEHARGFDLYRKGKARTLAYRFYKDGPRAFDAAVWRELLLSFNSLMRTTQKGSKTTVDEFFDTVDRLRLVASRKTVADVLDLVWQARIHAEEFQEGIADGTGYRALEPLIPCITQTARTWHEKLQTPLRLIHDEQLTLSNEVTRKIIEGSNYVPLSFQIHGIKPVPLREITQADSKHDPRIQVADIVAGVGRQIATSALDGTGNEELITLIRPYVDADSLWGDSESWKKLTGRNLPG